MPNTQSIQNFQSAVALTQGSMVLAIVMQLGANLIISSSSSALLNMVNALQISLMYQALNVPFPANAGEVYGLLRMIAFCDVFPSEIVSIFYFWDYFEWGNPELNFYSSRRLETDQMQQP